tara:strand:- start:355 stop:501 length:147 start_codon:yes stop_codon:yes gene_type:complete
VASKLSNLAPRKLDKVAVRIPSMLHHQEISPEKSIEDKAKNYRLTASE